MQTHPAWLLQHTHWRQATSAFTTPAGLRALLLTWGTANFKSAPTALSKKPQANVVFSFQKKKRNVFIPFVRKTQVHTFN